MEQIKMTPQEIIDCNYLIHRSIKSDGAEYGELVFGVNLFGESGGKLVFQRYWSGYNQYQAKPKEKRHQNSRCIKYTIPSNPQTPDQQANRTKFAQANEAWHNLSQEQRDKYNKQQRWKRLCGYNRFMQEYMRDAVNLPQ
jgi:hypothetical protein